MITFIGLAILLLMIFFLHKIVFCCVHGRALVAVRHESGFALRLFDICRQEFIKTGLAKKLLHGGDAEEFLFIRVVPGVGDCFGDGRFIGVLADRSSFDQLEAVPFFSGKSLLERILLDVGCPRDKVVYLGKDDLDLRVGQFRQELEVMLGELQVLLSSGAADVLCLAEPAPVAAGKFSLAVPCEIRSRLQDFLSPGKKIGFCAMS